MKVIKQKPVKWNTMNKFSYLWVTLILFFISAAIHWITAWAAYKNDQAAHHQPVKANEYVIETMRDTMENWQSEFLQLIWQVAGLSFLYFVGSSTSKEGDERMEEKMDYIIRQFDPERGEQILAELDLKYPKK